MHLPTLKTNIAFVGKNGHLQNDIDLAGSGILKVLALDYASSHYVSMKSVLFPSPTFLDSASSAIPKISSSLCFTFGHGVSVLASGRLLY